MTTINRAPYNALVDEPVGGDNTTGSIWNKTQIKNVLLDPIDVALGQIDATQAVGSWTPVDASGAGLVFPAKSGTYMKNGRMVIACGNVTFPATANAAPIAIGGLVHAAPGVAPYWGGLIVYTTANLMFSLPVANTIVNAYALNGGAIANSQLSGQELRFIVFYPAAS